MSTQQYSTPLTDGISGCFYNFTLDLGINDTIFHPVAMSEILLPLFSFPPPSIPSFIRSVSALILKFSNSPSSLLQCYGLKCLCPPPKLLCWTLMPNMMEFEDGPLGGRVLMNGISTLIKAAGERSLIPSIIWGYSEKTAWKGRRLSSNTKPAGTVNLGLSASIIVRNKLLLFINHPVYFIIAAQVNYLKYPSFCLHSFSALLSQHSLRTAICRVCPIVRG